MPAVAPALASAGQQRKEPAQAQGAVRAAQGAEPALEPAQLEPTTDKKWRWYLDEQLLGYRQGPNLPSRDDLWNLFCRL